MPGLSDSRTKKITTCSEVGFSGTPYIRLIHSRRNSLIAFMGRSVRSTTFQNDGELKNDAWHMKSVIQMDEWERMHLRLDYRRKRKDTRSLRYVTMKNSSAERIRRRASAQNGAVREIPRVTWPFKFSRVHFATHLFLDFAETLPSTFLVRPGFTRTHDTQRRPQRRTKNIKSGGEWDEKKSRVKKKGRREIVPHPHPADVPREWRHLGRQLAASGPSATVTGSPLYSASSC